MIYIYLIFVFIFTLSAITYINYDFISLNRKLEISKLKLKNLKHSSRILDYFADFARLCLKDQGRIGYYELIGFINTYLNNFAKKSVEPNYLTDKVVDDLDYTFIELEKYIRELKAIKSPEMYDLLINMAGELEAAMTNKKAIEELEQKKILFFLNFKK